MRLEINRTRRRAALVAALGCVGVLALYMPSSALAVAPTALTLRAFATSATGATVEGLVSPGGERTRYEVHFGLASSEWCQSQGLASAPEETSATAELPGTDEFEVVSVSLSGLRAGSRYCAEVIATNGAGDSAGGQALFTAGAPVVGESRVHSTATSAAAIEGLIDPAGQNTRYEVQYGLASSEWCATGKGTPEAASPPAELNGGSDFAPVSVEVTKLVNGEKYCAQLFAANNSGGEPGVRVIFTAGAPSARTGPLLSTTTTAAALQGLVDPAGQPTNYEVRYGLSSSEWCRSLGLLGSPARTTKPEQLAYQGGSFQTVAVELAGLAPGTAYCAELAASNPTGTDHGGQVTLTTQRLVVPPSTPPSVISTSVPPAPAAQGSLSQVLPPASHVGPTSGFTLSARPRVNARTGAVTFTASVFDPGVLSWRLSVENGSVYPRGARRSSCFHSRIRLDGRCRSARAIFGQGSLRMGTAGSVSFTVVPSAAAKGALRTARRRHQGIPIAAVVTFQASGAANSVSQARSFTVRLGTPLTRERGR